MPDPAEAKENKDKATEQEAPSGSKDGLQTEKASGSKDVPQLPQKGKGKGKGKPQGWGQRGKDSKEKMKREEKKRKKEEKKEKKRLKKEAKKAKKQEKEKKKKEQEEALPGHYVDEDLRKMSFEVSWLALGALLQHAILNFFS